MGMNGREMFIKRFVGEFYQKSLRKRRTKKNVAYNVPNIINNLCLTYFKVRPEFTEREIFLAFRLNGFTFMRAGKEDFTWERFHAGHVLVTDNLFINLDSQCNADLRLINRRTYPDNFKEETVNKLEVLKKKIQEFWEKNEHLLSR